MIVRLYNGFNDVYLTNESWENLIIEEDIFDWKLKGSIVIKTPYESLERESTESIQVSGKQKKDLVYKFRNDGRDTIFISIKPKSSSVPGLVEDISFEDKKWRIEMEGVVYDTEDLSDANITNKMKKLFFWDKTYQLMIERDSEFSTANSGKNKGKSNLDQVDNSEKSLKTGDSVGELLKSLPEFSKHAKNTNNKTEWDVGSDKNMIFYSSPVHAKFIDNLEYLLNYTTASDSDDQQPCIFKFERASTTMTPKQFSLKPIKKYFEKAGKDTAKDYQVEHFFIEENSENSQLPYIKKTPINSSPTSEIKADQYNTVKSYQLIDVSGLDYSQNLANYRVVSYNSSDGQFNEEGNYSKAEEYKKFYDSSISKNIFSKNTSDRLVLTPYIKEGFNTRTVYSLRNDALGRLADGRNRLLKYYLFSNLGIAFTVQGLTLRQPGRFFGLSKLTGNDKEHDSKLEGQYFVTNVVHHFSNEMKSYRTQITGIKTHTYKETTVFKSENVDIIKSDNYSLENSLPQPSTPGVSTMLS
jgi:hypothetical protein